MLWYRYRQVPGRQNRLPLADSGGAHVSKEPRMPKMGPHGADMAVAVYNGYVQDARRHAHQWTCTSTFSMIAMVWVSWLVREAGLFGAGCDVVFSSS